MINSYSVSLPSKICEVLFAKQKFGKSVVTKQSNSGYTAESSSNSHRSGLCYQLFLFFPFVYLFEIMISQHLLKFSSRQAVRRSVVKVAIANFQIEKNFCLSIT